MSPSEAAELDEFIANPALVGYADAGAYWHAHTEYARRAAIALTTGDLWSAQRAAAISCYALSVFRERGGGASPPAYAGDVG